MTVAAFTICTTSYLAQAGTLLASLRLHAPHWRLFIGLVDSMSSVPAGVIPAGVTVLPADQLPGVNAAQLAERYQIVELCTALKPSYFRQIFANDAGIDQVHYLDPDTCAFSALAPLEAALLSSPVTLTPHHLQPIPLDGQFPAENLALNHGIFNLGYLGLRRSETTAALLDWWEQRMSEHCVIDLREGYFVDQLWFNLAPVYYPEVMVLRHPGANVAYWNFHERRLCPDNRVEFAGTVEPLLFFHFSGFSPLHPEHVTRRPVRNDVDAQAPLRQLLSDYGRQVVAHGFALVRGIESAYARRYREHQRAVARRETRQHPLRSMVRALRQAIPEWIKRPLR